MVDPDIVKQYMFGTKVVSDWKEGSSIVWKGEWQGKRYEDEGTILKMNREHMISYSHFISLSGPDDAPENYDTVTIELSPKKNGTLVTLTQDNDPDEEARQHSEQNWGMMLSSLKKVLEQ